MLRSVKNITEGLTMSKQNKNKIQRAPKPFDIGAYELFNNKLYKPKIIPNKKKAAELKRKKVDIKNYLPFIFALQFILTFSPFNVISFYRRDGYILH